MPTGNLVTRREEERWYPCCCRIQIGTSHTGELAYSYCGAVVHGPDQPICTSCINNGHPEDPGFAPALVPARRQP